VTKKRGTSTNDLVEVLRGVINDPEATEMAKGRARVRLSAMGRAGAAGRKRAQAAAVAREKYDRASNGSD